MAARALLLTIVTAIVCTSAAAQGRTYAGGFSTRWDTVGWHGHDQPLCPEAAMSGPGACDEQDYRNANLDNSIGFRFGHERDAFRRGPLHFILGIEAGFTDSEYNLSQNHVTFVSANAVAGVDYAYRRARIGPRFGAGPFLSTDGHTGANGFLEGAVTVPIRRGAALRFSHRLVAHLDPSIRRGESSFVLVASPEERGTSRWEFAATTGMSRPDSLSLRSAAWQRLTASWFATPGIHVLASYTATAHESTVETTFMGFPANQRGKTIEGLGLGVGHLYRLNDRISLRYGGGLEVANWTDEHHLLVRDGEDVEAATEVGVTVRAGLRLALARHVAIEGTVEQLAWRGIDMNETRIGAGLVLTR